MNYKMKRLSEQKNWPNVKKNGKLRAADPEAAALEEPVEAAGVHVSIR